MRFNDAGIFPALWWRIGTRGVAARFPADAGGFAAVLSHISDLRRTYRRDKRGQKHVSAVKGGRLAAAAGRATKITLAVTDVPADQESALASGPTLPDPTTIA